MATVKFFGTTGLTHYCLLYDPAGRVWGGTGFEAYSAGDYADYALSAPESATAGVFGCDLPAVADGLYDVIARRRAGGTPAATDPTVGAGVVRVDGAVALPASPPVAGAWPVPPPDGPAADRDVVRKAAADRTYVAFDYGDHPAVVGGATVAAAALAVSPAGPTVYGPELTGAAPGGEPAPYRVATWVSGGTAGVDYTLTCTATLSNGDIVAGSGTLRVT